MEKAYTDAKSPFELKSTDEAAHAIEPYLHQYGKNKAVCDTDSVGYPTPGNRSPFEIVVDSSEGFVPLWDEDVTLRWRFQERSMEAFLNPEAAKDAIRRLFGEALLAWGDAAPVKFSERGDLWDFEIVVREQDRCSLNGCVLASAFFPDAGRHELVIYPKMFEQSAQEQIETLIHEIGHIFGLRHFFAKVSETAWPAEIFGEHSRFSIMNYGSDSILTENDTSDLKKLYELVWSEKLEEINGTPVRLLQPFSAVTQHTPKTLKAAAAIM